MSLSILIVKTSALGDIVQALPVAEYLKRKFPDATITWIVEEKFNEVVFAHPLIDRVLTFTSAQWRSQPFKRQTWQEVARFRKELRSHSYDLLFDLQGNAKSGLITLWAKAKEKVGFGFSSVPEKINLLVTNRKYELPRDLNIQQRYLKLAQAHFGDESAFVPQGIGLKITAEETVELQRNIGKGNCKILVAFSSKWINKQLSEETLSLFLKKVAGYLHSQFYFVWGNEEEKAVAKRLSSLFSESIVVDKMKVALLPALISHMNLVIAMDTGILHLCAMTKTPTYSFFGPSSAQIYKPLGSHHHHFQGTCPYGRTFVHRCPILRSCPTGACLRGVSADQLFESFRQQMT